MLVEKNSVVAASPRINIFSKTKVMTKEELFQKKKQLFHENFNKLMFELGIYNKSLDTYHLDIYEETNYGFKARIKLEPGLIFDDLEDKKKYLQQYLKCLWVMRHEPFDDFAEVKIITKKFDVSRPYRNPFVRENQIYLGIDYSLEDIILNPDKENMFLLAGTTGSGKTRLIFMILLSWIINCSPDKVEIYLSDIAKNEFNNFKYVNHVKAYADELEDLHKMAIYLEQKLIFRKNKLAFLREQGKDIANIEEYNKIITDDFMSYCYLLIDEFSIVVADKTDTPQEKKMKEKIMSVIKKIAKLGRGVGIFCFLATQKTTKEEIPAILKNMCSVRISFRANDVISSEVIMGDNSAVNLADRMAVFSTRGGPQQEYLFSPYLTTEKLNKQLRKYSNRNPKADLIQLTKVLEKRIKEKDYFDKFLLEEPKIRVEEIIETPKKLKVEQQFRYENIKKEEKKVIPNLPYEVILHDNMVVKDDKKIDLSKTQKKVKKNGWFLLEEVPKVKKS